MSLDRRAFLLGLSSLACARPKAPRYNGYAFVSSRGDRALSAISLSRFALARQIPTGSAPGTLVSDPVRGAVYALLPDSGTILEVPARSLNIERRSRAFGPAVDLRPSPDRKTLWLLTRDAIHGWNIQNWKRDLYVRLPEPAQGFDLDTAGGMGVVAFPTGAALVNLRSGSVSRLETDGQPGFVSFQCKGERVFVSIPGRRFVTAFDTATGRRLVDLAVPVAGRHCCTNADGGQMFVTGEGMDAVVIVSPYQTEVGETILAGRGPGAMTVTAFGTPYLFVTNPGAGDTTIIAIDSRRMVASIQTGGQPEAVVMTQDNAYALILNAQSGDVGVFRLNTLQTASLKDRRSRSAPLFTVIPAGSSPASLAIAPIV